MLDIKGRLIRLGDRVAIDPGIDGVVVISLDTDEYSPDFPKGDWSDLDSGSILIRTDQGALVELQTSDEHTEVINQNSK